MSEEKSKAQKLKEKVEKDFPEFVDGIHGKNVDDLEKDLLRYAKYREETEWARQNDETLLSAKEKVKELDAPYKETLAALKNKMAYINLMILESSEE